MAWEDKMIKDLQLIEDITPLFEKKVVVWGIGNKGRVLIQQMKEMGAGKKGILLCDSKSTLWNEKFLDYKIMSPVEMRDHIKNMGIHSIIILVTVLSVTAQNEIIKSIEEMFGTEIDVYTEYAVEYGLYLGINNSYVDSEYKRKELMERQTARRYPSKEKLSQLEQIYKYFTFLPLYNDEIVLVYQPGKVASSTVYNSIKRYNRNALHCHILAEICDNEDDLYRLLDKKGGKIICLVRDPVARRISEMWQNIKNVERYAIDADFGEIEKYYFDGSFENFEFDWFDHEMKKAFHLDVFEYPFNQNKGYSIIKQGGIELLLMKMEKLDSLENVIGNFLGIEGFQLYSKNVGREKEYRFAIKEYKKNFILSKKRLTDIYRNNNRMRHFYSEQECDELYKKWAQ